MSSSCCAFQLITKTDIAYISEFATKFSKTLNSSIQRYFLRQKSSHHLKKKQLWSALNELYRNCIATYSSYHMLRGKAFCYNKWSHYPMATLNVWLRNENIKPKTTDLLNWIQNRGRQESKGNDAIKMPFFRPLSDEHEWWRRPVLACIRVILIFRKDAMLHKARPYFWIRRQHDC